MLIGAKKGSPLILGVGENEYILASDASAIVKHTTQVIYLADNEMVTITSEGFRTKTIDNVVVTKEIEQVEFSLEQLELGGFKHYMLKEIFEQPDSLTTCMGGRIDLKNHRIVLGGIAEHWRRTDRTRRIILTACGTAWHACLVGEFLLEQLARIPVRNRIRQRISLSQPDHRGWHGRYRHKSVGRDGRHLAAVEQAKERGAVVIGIVNAVGSTIARTTDSGVYLHVGPEIGVASTKAFTAQVAVLAMMAIELGRRRHIGHDEAARYIDELSLYSRKR